MHKKFCSFLLFLFLVTPSVYPWTHWITAPIRGVGHITTDLYHIFMPEWRTGSRFEREYKKNDAGKEAEFECANCIEEKDGKRQARRVQLSDLIKKIDAMHAGDQQSRYRSYLQDIAKEWQYFLFIEPAKEGDHELVDRVYAVDCKGDVFTAHQDGILSEVDPEHTLECIDLEHGNGARIYKIHHAAKFLEKTKEIDYSQQTDEELNKIHLLKDWYRFKRTYTLFGCYPCMKPYALVWATGLGIGAYKLYKKLGIYEHFIKPDTGNLQEDELDRELA